MCSRPAARRDRAARERSGRRELQGDAGRQNHARAEGASGGRRYPGREIPATVESISPASGSQFSLLPPENATGNFTKIVQRLPVRIRIDPDFAAKGLIRPGMSAVVRIDSRDRPDRPEVAASR